MSKLKCYSEVLSVWPLDVSIKDGDRVEDWTNVLVTTRATTKSKRPKRKYYLGWNGSRFANGNEVILMKKLFPEQSAIIEAFLLANFGKKQ